MNFASGPWVRGRVWVGAGVVLALSVTVGCATWLHGTKRGAQPERAMDRGVVALASLLPVAFEPSRWSEPGVAQEAERSVRALREAVEDLDRHAFQADVTFAFLARSLARETADLEQDIAQERSQSSARIARSRQPRPSCSARLLHRSCCFGAVRAHVSPGRRWHLASPASARCYRPRRSMRCSRTVNDLAMCGARPAYLSAGFILEEGLPLERLARIVASMGAAAKRAGVHVVTGDTKVVDRGKGDGLYITTALRRPPSRRLRTLREAAPRA